MSRTPWLDALHLAHPLSESDGTMRVYRRAQLGEGPGAEVIHITGRMGEGTVDADRLRVRRGQEGTTARAWPAGTPFVLLEEGAP